MLSTTLRRSVSTRKSNLTDTINHDRKRGGSFIEQASHNLKRRVGSVSKYIISSSQKSCESETSNKFEAVDQFTPY